MFGCSYVAGVVGIASQSSIVSCTNRANISGKSYVSGVCGCLTDSSYINRCINWGEVKANNVDKYLAMENVSVSIVGGVVGYASEASTIDYCTNRGEITGNVQNLSTVGILGGGVCGSMTDSTITRSRNRATGKVYYKLSSGNTGDTACLGGISGSGLSSNIEKSFNEAEITSKSDNGNYSTKYVGGIVGVMWYDSSISNSYNLGKIVGYERVGGIVGFMRTDEGSLDNCYNATLEVSGSSKVGNFAGEIETEAENSKYLVCVAGTTPVGKAPSGWNKCETCPLANMKTSAFLDYLNQGKGTENTKKLWVQDTNGYYDNLPFLQVNHPIFDTY